MVKRKKQDNKKIMWGGVLLVVVILIIFAVNNNGFFGGEDSSCGDRGKNEDKEGYCLTTKDDPDELIIVTGNTQNVPAPDLDFTKGELKELLSGVFYNSERGETSAVYIVSAAKSNYTIEYKNEYSAKQNIRASNNELRKLGKELNEAIKESPSEASADYLGGILKAKSLIDDSVKNPVIIVVGSGYSDSGVLNFASDDLIARYRTNPEDITNLVSKSKNIREGMLDGAKIYWYNIGEVTSPQPNMNGYKEDTKEIYQIALKYLGAGDVKFYANDISADVKSVESQYSVNPTYVDELKVGDVFKATERVAKFNPDQSTLVNSDEAKANIKSFAKRFNADSGVKLRVIGYIAHCDYDNGELGLARANAIKNILVEFGIPEDKIETVGKAGMPPNDTNEDEEYICNSNLPDEEKRTVNIKVVKD